MIQTLRWCTNLFPVWVLIAGIWAMSEPAHFTWFNKPKIIWGLGVIMLGMGITLKLDDFKQVLKLPKPIALGVGAQFLIMPLLGWSIATLMNLPREFAIGLILVSCCPGGTASNVVAYIARAHLPLSLLMTMCSTLAAIVLTPLLSKFYLSEIIQVDAVGLFMSTVKVVLAPVLLGVLLHHLFPRAVTAVGDVAPLISVITIALICGSIIGGNVSAIKEHGGSLILAVVLLHGLAFLLGYFFARLFGYDELIRRTVSIEVGMQNSGLGTVLANAHFANQATGVCLPAVPCAISATVHSIIGSILAAIWRSRLPKETPVPSLPEQAAE
jgi:BASS family bile acid:Na+ symporter